MPPPPKSGFYAVSTRAAQGFEQEGQQRGGGLYGERSFEGLLGRLITVGGKSKYFFPLLLTDQQLFQANG